MKVLKEKMLFNSHSFLSGGIDRIDDDGVGWRKSLIARCENDNLGIVFFDPCDKPKGLGSEIGLEKEKVKSLVELGLWEEARECVKMFRHYDLRAIDRCDFVVVKIDINTHLCGTYNEIFLAERQNKPIFVIMGEGQKKKDIPTWLISFINENEIFESEDEFMIYLNKINNGEIELDKRWVKLY